MEELIKRLERVIQTGAPDKDGQHPISAETVLEVAKGLSEHGTNLAEVGTDCSEFPNNSDVISRQAAIDALCNDYCGGHQDCKYYPNCENLRSVQKLPSAQPERAGGTWMPDTMCYYEERFICSECKENYKVDTCMGKPMWNFCPNCGAKMEVTE